MNTYLQGWKKYATFKGRSTRSEYWSFVLINMAIVFIVVFIDAMLGISWDPANSVFVILFQFAMIIPNLAVGVRRMHDSDHSGWFIILPIVNLIFAIMDGTSGPNRFGMDPRNRNPKADPESMAMRSPVPQRDEDWQCSNCNTKNSSVADSCATCGQSAPTY